MFGNQTTPRTYAEIETITDLRSRLSGFVGSRAATRKVLVFGAEPGFFGAEQVFRDSSDCISTCEADWEPISTRRGTIPFPSAGSANLHTMSRVKINFAPLARQVNRNSILPIVMSNGKKSYPFQTTPYED
jgi:hypothetical protein